MVYTMYGFFGIRLQSLHNSLILNALPVPMLRQVFLSVVLMPKFNAEIVGEKVVPEVDF